ncbi:MAG: hypothetical protein OCD02_20955 [Spirochaetaceae bacterium]
MYIKKIILRFCVIFLINLTFISCDKEVNTSLLEKEDKFTLPIGNMDNELDFFSREGISFSLESDIYMSNGIFLISNGNGKKIMKFSSYGDLLKKISSEDNSETQFTDSIPWEFNKPGVIAATQNHIFIEDTVTYDSNKSEEYIDKTRDLTSDKSDDEKHILNEKIISYFNLDGEYIGYIGQNGINGTPFPFINNIYTNKNNELIVITQTTFFWSIYRFTEDGDIIDKNIIELDYLPKLENESDIITQINNIIPDREKDRVLVELTFYRKIFDDKTGATISLESIKSRVFYFDLLTKSYISWMDIPDTKKDNESSSKHYVLLDIVKGKYLFFISQSLDGLSQFLTITNENGYIIGEYDLQIDNTNIIFSSFYTTFPDGILTGLLCTEYAGGVSMWRTDKIILEDSK